MDPVNSLSEMLAILRRQVSERAAKLRAHPAVGPSSSPESTAATAEELQDIRRKLQERIRALDADDERRHGKAVRIFLEGVFRREFGDSMLTDPAFYALIDDVQLAMESDPKVNQTLHRLVKELAEGS